MKKEYSVNSNKKINQNLKYLRYKLSKTNPEILEELTDALVQASKGKIEPCKMTIESQDNFILIFITGQDYPRYSSGRLTDTLQNTIGLVD